MKAVVIRKFADVQQRAVETLEAPKPGAGQVTIDVEFAGVGLVDVILCAGGFDFVPTPVTPGIEVAGRIREVGSDVRGLVPDMRVAALLTDFNHGGFGGYAEIAVARPALTIPLEEGYDPAQAAAAIGNGATAFIAASDLAGRSVVISGASGGLGQWLIRAARAGGAKDIIALSRNRARHAALLELGATEVQTPDEWRASERPFDVACDTTGGWIRELMAQRLSPLGRLTILGNASGEDTPLSGDSVWLRSLKVDGITVAAISQTEPERVLKAARQAFDAARDMPAALDVYPLEEWQDAHRALRGGSGRGKFVLKVG